MSLAPNPNLVKQAADDLFAEYQKPTIEALLTSYVTQLQEVDTALVDVCNVLDLATAADAQLDLIGTILDTPRNGRTDDQYRTFLSGRIAAGASRGTGNDLVGLLRLLLDTLQTTTLVELYPGVVHITIPDPLPLGADINTINELLQLATPAGVDLSIIFTLASPYFGFLGDPNAAGFNTGAFAGVVS